MPIKVQCACGKAFAAKDELAGKTVKCPSCQQALKIPGGAASPAAPPAKAPAAKPAAAKQPAAAAAPKAAPKTPAAADAGAHLFDEVGLQPVAVGTRPCPGCTEPMPTEAVICIKCGYSTKIGRRMSTVKVSGDEGPVGHGAVAQGLLDRAAAVMEEDVAEEKKKTTEGMPWWVYLIGLAMLIGLATWMLFNWGIEKPQDDQKGSFQPSLTRPIA